MESLEVAATIGAPELLIIFGLVLLVFGGAKLPKLARSLGQAQREFRTGLSDSSDDKASGDATGTDNGNSDSSSHASNGSKADNGSHASNGSQADNGSKGEQ